MPFWDGRATVVGVLRCRLQPVTSQTHKRAPEQGRRCVSLVSRFNCPARRGIVEQQKSDRGNRECSRAFKGPVSYRPCLRAASRCNAEGGSYCGLAYLGCWRDKLVESVMQSGQGCLTREACRACWAVRNNPCTRRVGGGACKWCVRCSGTVPSPYVYCSTVRVGVNKTTRA